VKAERCPVCYGKGVVPDKPPSTLEVKCHGCDGKGWVSVPEDTKPELVELDGVFYDRPPPLTLREPADPSSCPSCGGDRNSPGGTGCPIGSHYGTYCYDRQ